MWLISWSAAKCLFEADLGFSCLWKTVFSHALTPGILFIAWSFTLERDWLSHQPLRACSFQTAFPFLLNFSLKKKMCWWFKTKIYSSLGWIVWHLVSSLCRKKKKINHFWKVWMSGCRDGSAVKSAISLAEHSTFVLSTCTGWLRLPVISALGHLAPSPGFCRHLQPHVH